MWSSPACHDDCALATDAETTWKMLLDGQSGIRTLDDPFVEEFDLPVRIGGHLLEEFDSQLTRVELRRLGYLQRMSTVLSRRVWEHAGSPEVDTNRLMVSIGTGMGSSEELLFAYDGMRANAAAGGSHRWLCRCTCPTRAAAAVGLERKAKAGVMHPDLGLRVRVRRASPGLAADRARRGRRRDLRWRRDQDRGGADRRRSPRCASCCPPTTTTRPAPAARSTRTATGSSSARAARCW